MTKNQLDKTIRLYLFSEDKHEVLETEHQQMRIKFFEMKQKHDDLMDKMSFFTKVLSNVSF